MKTIHLFFAMILLINCTTDSTNETIEELNNQGILTLSGEDTSIVGNELQIGDIAFGREDLTGLENTIVIVSKGANISEEPPSLSINDPDYVESIIDFPDKKNTFVIVAGEKLISMVIVTNGIERRYTCDSTYESSIACGSIILNKDSKKAIFLNSTVKNAETGTVLTINGTISW